MDIVEYYQATFGVDLAEAVAAMDLPASQRYVAIPPVWQPQRTGNIHLVILPTAAAIIPHQDRWALLQPTPYALTVCAHAMVTMIFERTGAGRQLELLDALEITHSMLATIHGEEYLAHDRVQPAITAVLMALLPPLWNALVPMYRIIVESDVGESFVSSVRFDSWKGSDMVVAVETFNPGSHYAAAHAAHL